MVSNYHLFFKIKIIILLLIFNTIKANEVVDRSENLSRNKIRYIDDTTPEDGHVVLTGNVYRKMNRAEYAEIENDTSYDYDHLVNEYYNDENEFAGPNSNTTYNEKSIASNSSDEDQSMGWKSIKYSLYDVWSRRQRIVLSRLWNIVKVWFVIYLVVAVPLWCTRGWCGCCLFCKIFKPAQTIDEAKRYLEANPPGVLQDKKGGVIFYEPTSNERECYEKFGHLIRTI